MTILVAILSFFAGRLSARRSERRRAAAMAFVIGRIVSNFGARM